MKNTYLLKSEQAEKIYEKICSLPIVDYHCHLSPKEIYEDKPFDNIGEMWLAGDHYKWRLMRTAGIDEKYITGNASWKEKFLKYAKALEFAAGNPLYHWSHMELSMFFGIDTPLKSDNAAEIYDEANAYIAKNKLSPRKLIEQSDVEVICTTDDITDDLSYHKLISEDKSFKTKVLPSFRTDNLLLIKRDGYGDYIKKLSEVSGIAISTLADLKTAVKNRLDFFCECGCKFTDVGIPYFPNSIADDDKANQVFADALHGKEIDDGAYRGFIGNMYLFLAEEYYKRNLVMQMHLAVYRNANSALFRSAGADCGADCVGDEISGTELIKLLDAINENSGMPKTILYTLNPGNAAQIASVAGAFPNVRCGAALWFCDHKRGIKEEIEIIAENSSLGSFLGMLTDSRSFLSYARHDYFRRILSDILGDWVKGGEYDEESAEKLAAKISYYNVKELTDK
ncbi:MAG: glucuronate isomerase [Acutalibacteraceae bacterium]|nr:glucuronate isomerase [Acutalibacteraceae bacterium]